MALKRIFITCIAMLGLSFGLLMTSALANVHDSISSINSHSSDVSSHSMTPVTVEELTHYIKTYARQGHHRTGSKVDHQSAEWMKSILENHHIKVGLETFSLLRPVAGKARLVLENKPKPRILFGMPMLNSSDTGDVGLSSRLGNVGEMGIIPVFNMYVLLPTKTISGKLILENRAEFHRMLRSRKYPAIIVATHGGKSGLAPFNLSLRHHYQTPVILVSSAFSNLLEMKAKMEAGIRVITNIKRERANASNVIAKIPGSNPKLKPLVVLTPRSAWWNAAAERGTAIAAWLTLAKRIKQIHPQRTVYFVALTGHELGYMGLKHFITTHPKLVSSAKAWVEIGANIAAAPTAHYYVQASSHRLQRLAEQAFHANHINNAIMVRPHHKPIGAISVLDKHNGQYIAFVGYSNDCYHLNCDTWPKAVNMGGELRFTQALIQIVKKLSA